MNNTLATFSPRVKGGVAGIELARGWSGVVGFALDMAAKTSTPLSSRRITWSGHRTHGICTEGAVPSGLRKGQPGYYNTRAQCGHKCAAVYLRHHAINNYGSTLQRGMPRSVFALSPLNRPSSHCLALPSACGCMAPCSVISLPQRRHETSSEGGSGLQQAGGTLPPPGPTARMHRPRREVNGYIVLYNIDKFDNN